MVAYFFDTYAILEVINGNPNYKKYLNSGIVVTQLNLIELYYILLKNFDSNIAEKYYFYFKPYLVFVEDLDIVNASKSKLRNKSLSYCDCLGYVISLRLNIPFLTGDKEFENLTNVEFVK